MNRIIIDIYVPDNISVVLTPENFIITKVKEIPMNYVSEQTLDELK